MSILLMSPYLQGLGECELCLEVLNAVEDRIKRQSMGISLHRIVFEAYTLMLLDTGECIL